MPAFGLAEPASVTASQPDRAGSNPLYMDLQKALLRYRERWANLPNSRIPAGPTMRPGQAGSRVALLRSRLGLPAGSHFDAQLAAAVRDYRQTHGLGEEPLVDGGTVESLNRGPAYYERLILLNLERARALPTDGRRYVLVDAAAARLWLYADGKARDSMKVIVGTPASPTPIMTTLIRFAEINPYWNIPPDMVQRLIAPRALKEGAPYLRNSRYEVLSDWSNAAAVIEPATVDWKKVAAGSIVPRVRQRPGVGNFMGEIKFVSPNDQGIYLHDTPNKALFARGDRWLSNGCVRVEDARRLARWLLGDMPLVPSRDTNKFVPLAEPVPIYITYLTAAPASPGGDIVFRKDPYRRDAPALASMFGSAATPGIVPIQRPATTIRQDPRL